MDRVDLSAHGFYATPGIGETGETGEGWDEHGETVGYHWYMRDMNGYTYMIYNINEYYH